MAKNIQKVANSLGATLLGQVPATGGGAFGAARLAQVYQSLQARLVPSPGQRTGRPTDPSWVRHPKVPMSEKTEQLLVRLAKEASTADRRISPMQLAAEILESALSGIK
jgi:hypothetical protein